MWLNSLENPSNAYPSFILNPVTPASLCYMPSKETRNRDQQLVVAYGGGQDLVKFKIQAHGKGNRLILLGQKPAQ